MWSEKVLCFVHIVQSPFSASSYLRAAAINIPPILPDNLQYAQAYAEVLNRVNLVQCAHCASPSKGLMQVPSAQGKCTKQLHLGAPDKCTSIGQSPQAGGGTHLEKQGSREASYSGCSGSGVGAWWPLSPGLSHLTNHMGRQPFLWRHSDHQPTKQPTNRADASFSAGAVLVLDDIGERLGHRIKANCN